MGIFSFLHRKNESKNEVDISESEMKTHHTVKDEQRKGIADAQGLYPADLILLSLAHCYRVTEKAYPRYLSCSYGITNPNKELKKLEGSGFLRQSTAKECLPMLKVQDLKAIATSVQIQSKKTKAALLEELSALSEIQLDKYVHEKYWVLTEKGQKELDCNKYIQFFLEKHSYALEEIGIDLWVVNEAIIQNPKVRYRDEIWHLLNKKENEISIKIQTEPYSGTGLTNLYCNIYRAMALFVEEEGQYINAADYYFQYIYKWVNIHCGLNFFTRYKYAQNQKEKAEEISRFYEDIKLYPYQIADIIRLKAEMEIDDIKLQEMLKTSFARTKDVGIFSYEELAEFIRLELNEKNEESQKMCSALAKAAIRQTSGI